MYTDTELYSKADLVAYAEREVATALKTDRELAKQKVAAVKAQDSGDRTIARSIAFVVTVIVLVLGYGCTRPEAPQEQVNKEFRWVGDSCFVVNETEYCSIIVDKDKADGYNLR